MYAAHIRLKVDREDLEDLDDFVTKASKSHKGTFMSRGYSYPEKIREYVRDFYKKSSAKAWIRDVRGFASNQEDVTVKSSRVKKIQK